MGRQRFYRPGSWYVTDDRTGFPTRAENTRKQWNGVVVDEKVWEPRQPQDLVRGVKDNQSVHDARPKPAPVWTGPVSQETSAALSIGQILVPMQSLQGFRPNDKIGIMLSTGGYFFTHLLAFIGGALVILNPLPGAAPAGSIVTDFGPNDNPLQQSYMLEETTGRLMALEQGGLMGFES